MKNKTPLEEFLKFKSFGLLPFLSPPNDPIPKKQDLAFAKKTFIAKGLNVGQGGMTQIRCNKGTPTDN